MYRILKKSIENFCASFEHGKSDARYGEACFFELLCDTNEYERQKSEQTDNYKNLSSFLDAIGGYERCELILHELKVLGIEPKKYVTRDFSEQIKQFFIFLDSRGTRFYTSQLCSARLNRYPVRLRRGRSFGLLVRLS